MTNLTDFSIKKLHQLLTKKEISSVELVKESLKQAQQKNPQINAFITLCEKEAFEQAQIADKAIKENKATLLTGIPYGMKDAYITKDIQTTSASNVLKGYTPPYNATVYQKLLDQNAVLIGKHNMDAWGHGGSSENTDFYPVKNPWDTKRTAGGSSGGSAAALAAGIHPFAIGEDTGGSIRNPSSFCNTTGLKVSYGRVSRYGAIAYASSLDTVGPMARSVEDLIPVLQTIAGFDPHDASSSKHQVPDYSQNLEEPLKGKKIGLLKEYFETDSLDGEVKASIKNAIKDFENLGAETIEVSLPTTKYGVAIYYILALSETSSNLARYTGVRYGTDRSHFTEETMRRIMLGTYTLSAGYYDAYYKKALKARTQLINEFNRVFEKVDVILAPVMPFPPYELGKPQIGDNYVTAMYLADLYTCATNPAGIPSLALPAGFTQNNLPVGMQLMGPMFSENTLFHFGYQFQKNTDYHTKRPSL